MQTFYLMGLIYGDKWIPVGWLPWQSEFHTVLSSFAPPALCCHLGAGCVQKEGLWTESFCLEAESWHPQNSLREFPQELTALLWFLLVSSLGFGHKHLLIFFFFLSSFIFLFVWLFTSFLIFVYLDPPKLPSCFSLSGAASAPSETPAWNWTLVLLLSSWANLQKLFTFCVSFSSFEKWWSPWWFIRLSREFK